jgi:enamine deaminase RidA (YjgF/YER057c/UK114 family)
VFDNLQATLQAVGASFEQVVKLTLPGRRRPAPRRPRGPGPYVDTEHPPASTAVEVRRLVHDDLLLEVEAVAAVP